MDASNRDDRNLDPATAYGPAAEQPGMTITGRYKLLEAIGKGGMGMVWVARPNVSFLRSRVASGRRSDTRIPSILSSRIGALLKMEESLNSLAFTLTGHIPRDPLADHLCVLDYRFRGVVIAKVNRLTVEGDVGAAAGFWRWDSSSALSHFYFRID